MKIDEIKKLSDKPHIVIVGGTKNSNGYRIYAYGGCIGIISTENTECELANEDYKKHIKDSDKQRELEKLLSSKNDKHKILLSDDYINLICEATKNKFTTIKGQHKERYQQTEIAKCLMNLPYSEKNPFIVTDIEFTFESQQDKNIYKPDFIAFDGKNIYLIEFKYNGKSIYADNGVKKHFEDFNNLTQNIKAKKYLYEETEKRINQLIKINDNIKECIQKNIPNISNANLIFAFLFIGNKKETISGIQTEYGKINEQNLKENFKNTLCWFFDDVNPEEYDFSLSSTLGEFADLN